MYVPAHFAVTEPRSLLSFIESRPFGVLVSQLEGKPFATHVPFVILETEPPVLGLHVAMANPQWRELDGANVLAIFQGAHGMVSASWYAESEKTVPTWNYAAVHCSGRARLTQPSGTRRILQALIDRFEQGWTIEAADPEYIERMERAIVGIEIPVESMEGAFKYSQNRTPVDRALVIEALSASERESDRELAREMIRSVR